MHALARKDDSPQMTVVNASGRVLETVHVVHSRNSDFVAQLVVGEHEDASDKETAPDAPGDRD